MASDAPMTLGDLFDSPLIAGLELREALITAAEKLTSVGPALAGILIAGVSISAPFWIVVFI